MAVHPSCSYYETKAHEKLQQSTTRQLQTHLRDHLMDEKRNSSLYASWNGIHLDYSRQKVDSSVMEQLLGLADEMHVSEKIHAMLRGDKINTTEHRSVLHTALRLPADQSAKLADAQSQGLQGLPGVSVGVDGPKQLLQEVHDVLGSIKKFAHFIRSGEWLGITGKPLRDVICVGIGGSYLGPEFVYEALRTEAGAAERAAGRRLRFLANVDPVDVKRATEGLHPETTLVIIVSKTFTTAETMLNARTLKDWLLKSLKTEAAIAKHVCAVSTNMKLTSEFGISPDNVFGFWDWVGGRFSVTSAVGVLPLAIHFGWQTVQSFLEGCHSMDTHFQTAPFLQNLPVLMGLLSVWNATYLDYNCVAVLPYAQCLHRFAAHVQQLAMESNGKSVMTELCGRNGESVFKGPRVGGPGEIFFGEPGTNGQHSFYQLLHQGQVVPAEFIGFAKSQNPICLMNETVSNHDELMSNFFAQPDALALGKTKETLIEEGVDKNLVPHKVFSGDRPSSMLLLPECSPFYVGCLLALYEHRTAVEGFLWGINSFDQWGVELGKVLAKQVRSYLQAKRTNQNVDVKSFCSSTVRMMNAYFSEEGKCSTV